MNEQAVETEIQAKGLNAPRLSPEKIDATIIGEDYHVFPGTTVTVCCLKLRNGFNVIGESAAASPENFDAELGRKIARRDAREKIWALEGYLLRERLHRASEPATVENIAMMCHEVNRAYCQAIGDNSQPAWQDAPQWQHDSAVLGVHLHTEKPDAGPAASHESWMAQKLAEGWTYGPVKDPEAKTHPCIIPFNGLSSEQQAKDYIFRAVVHAALAATKP